MLIFVAGVEAEHRVSEILLKWCMYKLFGPFYLNSLDLDRESPMCWQMVDKADKQSITEAHSCRPQSSMNLSPSHTQPHCNSQGTKTETCS